MDIYNKEYKRIGALEDSDTFVPINTEQSGDTKWIIFSNGARCKEETFYQDFEFVGNITNENKININNADYIDPDAFFAPSAPESLLNDIETVLKDPNALSKTKYDLSEPQAPAHMLAAMEKRNVAPNLLHDRLNANLEPPDFPDLFPQNRLHEQPTAVSLPEWNVFDRVKKSDNIQISIPFDIKLPKANKIDTMDDMFETSFIDYLAKQYIETVLLKNTELLKEILSDSIREWVDNEMSNKRKKSKIESRIFEINTKPIESSTKKLTDIEQDNEEVENIEEVEDKEKDTDEKD